MFKLGFFSLFISLFMLLACTKQEAPMLKSEVKYTQSDIAQLKACQEFRPYDHQLSHEMTLKMFECNKWDKQFPELYEAINKTPTATWAHIFSPIDEKLFQDEIGRKKFIGIFKKLESEQGLNDLGKIGTSFFKSPLVKIIADESFKEDIKDLLKILKLSPEKRLAFFKFFQAFNQNLKKNDQVIKKNLHPFLTEKVYGEVRLWMADYLAKRYTDNNLDQDLEFISQLLNPKLNEAWFYRWIKSDYVDHQSFTDIFEYPVLKRPEVHNDALYARQILNKGFVCKNNNNGMDFNINSEIKTIINVLTTKNQEVFFERQVDHKNKILFFENVCDQIEVNQQVDKEFLPTFKRLFVNINEFFDNEMNYIFTQGFHKTARFTKNDYYYLDFISGDFFGKVNDLTRLLSTQKQEGFYEMLYHLLKDNNAAEFSSLSEAFRLVGTDEDVKAILRGYARMWLKLSRDEKRQLAETFDVFFSPEVKSHLILESYLNFFAEFPTFIDHLNLSLNDTNVKGEKLYQSLNLMAKSFAKDEVLADLQRYFGEDHMMKVVHAILNGFSTSETSPFIAVSNQIDEVFIPFVPTQNYRFIESYKVCIADLMKLTDRNVDYYAMMGLYPESCKNLDHGPITHDLFVWYGKINQNYQATYGPGSVLFDRDGLLSKNALQQIIVAVVELGRAYKQVYPDRDLGDFVEGIYQVIIERKNTAFFETILKMGGEYYQNLTPRSETNFKNILKKLIATEDDKIKNFVTPIGSYLKDFKAFTVPERKLHSKNDCRDLNPSLGYNPCVSRHEVKAGVRRLVQILTRRFEGSPGLLEETVALLHPEGGIEIPYPEKKKSKKHVVSIEEIVRFFYHNQSSSDLRPMEYSTPEGTKTYMVDNVSSIEVVIRDIAFLNNFYGAFFMNTVASAKDYQDKVRKLESQVKLMVNSGGILRKTKIYPEETAWLLKNVKSSYYGLIHVADQFKLGSEFYSYDDMMQAILATVVKTSHPDVQKYTAFWLPNTKFGNLHNGEFLTQFVKLSGMRNLGLYLKSRLGNDPEKIFANKNFRRFTVDLPKRVHLKTLQETLRYITDHYAKDDNDVLYEALDDLLDWTDGLNEKEISKLEDFIVNFGLLITHSDDQNVDQWVSAFKDIFKVYRPLKNAWPSQLKVITLVEKANSFFEFLLNKIENGSDEKVWYNQLVSILKSLIIEQPGQVDEVLAMVAKKPIFWVNSLDSFMIGLEKFYQSLTVEDLENFDQLLHNLLSSKEMNFTGLKFWLEQTTKEGKHHLEILKLMDFLSKTIRYENQETTNFKLMIEEFLGKEGDDLAELLNCMAEVITIK